MVLFSGTSKQDNSRHSHSADRFACFLPLFNSNSNSNDDNNRSFGYHNTCKLVSTCPAFLKFSPDNVSSITADVIIADSVQSDLPISISGPNSNFFDDTSVKSRIVHCFAVSSGLGNFVKVHFIHKCTWGDIGV
jgi:hypothetical protein